LRDAAADRRHPIDAAVRSLLVVLLLLATPALAVMFSSDQCRVLRQVRARAPECNAHFTAERAIAADYARNADVGTGAPTGANISGAAGAAGGPGASTVRGPSGAAGSGGQPANSGGSPANGSGGSAGGPGNPGSSGGGNGSLGGTPITPPPQQAEREPGA